MHNMYRVYTHIIDMHIVWDMHRVYTSIQSVSLENTLVYIDMYMKFTHAKVHNIYT